MTSISLNDQLPRGRLASFVGVMIAFLVPTYLCAAKNGLSLVEPSSPAATYINELAMWSITLVMLGIVLFWEKSSLKSIGLGRLDLEAVCFGALSVLPLLALSLVTSLILKAFGIADQDNGQANIVLTFPLWLQLFIAITAGFTEEVLFRGYPIERIKLLTGSRWLAAFLPVIMFGTAHAPFWGIAHALIAGLTGFWLTLLYLWRRNLWVNIVAHAMMDGALFLALDMNAGVAAPH